LGRLAQFRGVLQSLNLAARVATALERTLELDPNHAGAWHALGVFHHEVPWIAGGRSALVVSSFERAIAIEPHGLTHRVEFARVLLERDEPDAAREHLDVALTLPVNTYFDRQDRAAAEALLSELP
jgi:Tfp pilus assembly protein PilF